MCKNAVHNFLWESYKDLVRHHFRHHPEKDAIMERLEKSKVSDEEIQTWLSEADRYTAEWMHSRTELRWADE